MRKRLLRIWNDFKRTTVYIFRILIRLTSKGFDSNHNVKGQTFILLCTPPYHERRLFLLNYFFLHFFGDTVVAAVGKVSGASRGPTLPQRIATHTPLPYPVLLYSSIFFQSNTHTPLPCSTLAILVHGTGIAYPLLWYNTFHPGTWYSPLPNSFLSLLFPAYIPLKL